MKAVEVMVVLAVVAIVILLLVTSINTGVANSKLRENVGREVIVGSLKGVCVGFDNSRYKILIQGPPPIIIEVEVKAVTFTDIKPEKEDR